MKKLTINQSNYIPWRGRFDMIAAADEYMIFDNVDYTPRNWLNRNVIKTSQGLRWVTIPVNTTRGAKIRDVRIAESDIDLWNRKHWKTLEINYKRAKHFEEVSEWLRPLYFENMPIDLHSVNWRFIIAICDYLGMKTKISHAWDYGVIDGDTPERIVDLCKKINAEEYISPPGAKDYIPDTLFKEAGIKLTFFDYDGFRPYKQLWGDFVEQVSILDLLFNCGKNSVEYMRNISK